MKPGLEVKNEFFAGRLPAGWRESPQPKGKEPEFEFESGRFSVRINRYGAKDSSHADSEAYLRSLDANPTPLERAGKSKVAGREVSRRRRLFDMRIDDEHGSAGVARWVYEEQVIVPAGKEFWVLVFQSSSSVPKARPAGVEEWRRFLSSFRLLDRPKKP